MPIVMKETTKEEKELKSYEIAAKAADDKKSWDIVILNMEDSSMMADYFVICSARNNRQAQSIADNIDLKTVNKCVELLIDAGEVVAHVFVEQDRQYYDLENLWCDAERIPFEGE